MDDCGFIVLRHVSTVEHNLLWINCCEQIRKFYDNPIVIIDDNSNKSILEDRTFDNCRVINSEFSQRGELLPYYYLFKEKLFEKAIVLHDSAFIIRKIDLENYNMPIHLLWDAVHTWDVPHFEKYLINILKNNDVLLDFYDKKDEWKLCFGVMSIVTYDYLVMLEEKYSFFNLIHVITNRYLRMALERVWGLLAYLENQEVDKSVLGNIHNDGYKPWEYRIYNFLLDKDIEFTNIDTKYKVLKCWSGR